MKFVSTQLSHYMNDRYIKRNIWLLVKYIIFVAVVTLLFAALFLVIMSKWENRDFTWATALYWVLTVMSTLGFGDITFESDMGRTFSMVVLFVGNILLLIVLPFIFIRFFYAPWVEAQVRARAPRAVDSGVSGHVILAQFDPVARNLVPRLKRSEIPYFILEDDPTKAADLQVDGYDVVSGEIDSVETWRSLRAGDASLIVLNRSDTVNTATTITIREVDKNVPVAAIASAEQSIDILELSGATHVLALKKWLGEHMARIASTSHASAHVIGKYRSLVISEISVNNTPYEGLTVQHARVHESHPLDIVACWDRGKLTHPKPGFFLGKSTVAIVIGTPKDQEKLQLYLKRFDINPHPVLIVGGGTVGRAAAKYLTAKGVKARILEQKPELISRCIDICEEVITGDAAAIEVMKKAGIQEAPSVLLTTNEDPMNIYLTSYCRNLNQDLRIIARITNERNVPSVHRAGADFALSYGTMGEEAITGVLRGEPITMLSEGVDFFSVSLPPHLSGHSIRESGIESIIGLNVIAVDRPDEEVISNPKGDFRLKEGDEILLLGSESQFDEFKSKFV